MTEHLIRGVVNFVGVLDDDVAGGSAIAVEEDVGEEDEGNS